MMQVVGGQKFPGCDFSCCPFPVATHCRGTIHRLPRWQGWEWL